MARRCVRGGQSRARAARRADQACQPAIKPAIRPVRLKQGRKALLLGTALTSTLLLGSFSAATPARAATCPQPPGGPINVNSPMTGSTARTSLISMARLVSRLISQPRTTTISSRSTTAAISALARSVSTLSPPVPTASSILSTPAISRSAASPIMGIFARTGAGANSPITINNSGTLDVTTAVNGAYGIIARTSGANSRIGVTNTGDINATSTATDAYGIYARSSAIPAASRSTIPATSRSKPNAMPLACSLLPLARTPIFQSRTAPRSRPAA